MPPALLISIPHQQYTQIQHFHSLLSHPSCANFFGRRDYFQKLTLNPGCVFYRSYLPRRFSFKQGEGEGWSASGKATASLGFAARLWRGSVACLCHLPPSASEQGPRGRGHTAGQAALRPELLRAGSVGGRWRRVSVCMAAEGTDWGCHARVWEAYFYPPVPAIF